MDRRVFLGRVIKGCFAVLVSGCSLAVAYLYPARSERRQVRFFPVLDEDEIPRSGVRRVDFPYTREGREVQGRAFIASLPGGVTVFSPVCTHLGCLVNWDRNRKEFLCPCHGGRYAMDGTVIAGPPPAPLTRLPIEVRDGAVHIGLRV